MSFSVVEVVGGDVDVDSVVVVTIRVTKFVSGTRTVLEAIVVARAVVVNLIVVVCFSVAVVLSGVTSLKQTSKRQKSPHVH